MAAEAIAAKTQVTSAAAQADASAKAEQKATTPVKPRPAKDEDSTLEEVVTCSAFKNAVNTAPRET